MAAPSGSSKLTPWSQQRSPLPALMVNKREGTTPSAFPSLLRHFLIYIKFILLHKFNKYHI
jgi:hypothetical protein